MPPAPRDPHGFLPVALDALRSRGRTGPGYLVAAAGLLEARPSSVPHSQIWIWIFMAGTPKAAKKAPAPKKAPARKAAPAPQAKAETPVAPVYVDGEKTVTLKGENIADDFQRIVELFFPRHPG